MAKDVSLDTEVDSSGVARGMAEIRNHVKRSESEIAGSFARMFAVGALIELGRRVFEFGARVADLGEKLQVNTTVLQQWGGIAEQAGSSMEALAQGINKMEINRSKALAGDREQLQHFKNLGVTLSDLQTLSPDQLMLKIAHSSLNLADMVGILGKNANELIPTFRAVADGTIAFGAAMDENLIKRIDAADDALKRFGQSAKVFIAEQGSYVVKGVDHVLTSFKWVYANGEDMLLNMADAFKRAGSLDFGGFVPGRPKTHNKAAQVDEDFRKRWAPEPDKPARPRVDTDSLGGGGAAGGAGSGGGAGGSIDSAQKLADLKAQYYLESLQSEEKLAALEAQRADLEQERTDLLESGRDVADEVNDIEIELTKTEHEIVIVQDKIVASSERLRESVIKVREEWDKIFDKIVEIAKEEKAAAAKRRAEADAAAQAANLQRQKDSFEGLGTGINSSAPNFTDVALGLATDPKTGKVNQDVYNRQRALNELRAISGKGIPSSEIFAANYRITAAFQNQYRVQTAAANDATAQRKLELSAIIHGSVVSPVLKELKRQTAILTPPPG